MTRPTLEALGLALLLGLGYAWFKDHDAQLIARAGLKTSVDSLGRGLAASEAAQKVREAQIDTLAHQVDSLKRIRGKLLVRADTLVVRAAVQESVFVTRLPDSLKAGFVAVIATKDSIIASLLGVVRGDSLSSADQDNKYALRGATLAECQSGLAAALGQRDRAIALAQPSFLSRVLHEVPIVLTTVGAVLILRH